MSKKGVDKSRQTFLEDITSEDLEKELRRRKAMELKEQYERQLTISSFLCRHREVFVEFADLVGSKQTRDLLADEWAVQDEPIIVDFHLRRDDGLYNQCFSAHDGHAVWEEFEEEDDETQV